MEEKVKELSDQIVNFPTDKPVYELANLITELTNICGWNNLTKPVRDKIWEIQNMNFEKRGMNNE